MALNDPESLELLKVIGNMEPYTPKPTPTVPMRTTESVIRPIQAAAPKISTTEGEGSDIQSMANEIRLESPGGGVSGIPDYQSNLKEIWNGFRQGTASVVDSIDAVTNLVAKATGWEKGEAFAKLRDYIQPTEMELADKNFGPTLLRAIGAALPILAEFAVGTKGAGKLLSLFRAPQAIKGIATAPIVAFGGIEGLTTAGKGGTALETAKAIGKGTVMGATLGAAGLLPAIAHPFATAGVFGGMTALEGAGLQETLVQGIVGFGFGAHGAWKQTKAINTMRDYLANNGYDAEVVSKMKPSVLREKYLNTYRSKLVEGLQTLGLSETEISKLKDTDLESTFAAMMKEQKIKLDATANETKEALEKAPQETKTNLRQRYMDFLTPKDFDPVALSNVSISDLSRIANNPHKELWTIDPVSGKLSEAKTKAAKKFKEKLKESTKSTEELAKQAATSTSTSDKERAKAELAKRETDAERIIREIEEGFKKEQEQNLKEKGLYAMGDVDKNVTLSDAQTMLNVKLIAISNEINQEWALGKKIGTPQVTKDQFENLRIKYGVPGEKIGDLFNYLKENGIKVVKPDTVTMGDIADATKAEFDKATINIKDTVNKIDELIKTASSLPDGSPERGRIESEIFKLQEKVMEKETEVEGPKTPSRVLRAFREKNKNLITREQWDALPAAEQAAVADLLNKYYYLTDLVNGSLAKEKAWRESKKEEGGHIGRKPSGILTAQQIKTTRGRATTALRGIRSVINKETVHLQIEGTVGEKKARPQKHKTPMIDEKGKPIVKEGERKALKKRGFSDDFLNQMTSREDIKTLRKDKTMTGENTKLDTFGRIITEDTIISQDKAAWLISSIKRGETDDVLKAQGYTEAEIEAARLVKDVEKTPPKKKTQAEAIMEKAAKGEVKEEKATPKKKGLIKTLDEADMVWEKYLSLGEYTGEGSWEEQASRAVAAKKAGGKGAKAKPEAGALEEDIPISATGASTEKVAAADAVAEKRIALKNALEEFVGKKNLTDEQLRDELVKLAQAEAGKEAPVVENIDQQLRMKGFEPSDIEIMQPNTKKSIIADNLTPDSPEIKMVLKELRRLVSERKEPKPKESAKEIETLRKEMKASVDVITGYDSLSEKVRDILENTLGWSPESLLKIENPKLFDVILGENKTGKPLTPEVAQITEEGKLFIFGAGAPEIGYGEKVRKDRANLLKGEPDKAAYSEEELKAAIENEGVSKPDTGASNPDDIVRLAYNRARKPTPLEDTKIEFDELGKEIREHTEQMAKLRLSVLDPKTDPTMKETYVQTIEVLREELPQLTAKYEALKQTYNDLQEREGISEKKYAGPNEGETKIENTFMLDDGTGALIVSQGGQGVDRFFALQDGMGNPSPADSKGNKIGVEARVVKDANDPSKLELRVFKSDPSINPLIEDELLKRVVDKYWDIGGKEENRKVSKVTGVGDDVWQRREDIENEVRKSTSKADKDYNAAVNIINNRKTYAFTNWIMRGFTGAKGWKESYSQRRDLLESLSMLRSAADPQQFDPDNFKAEVFPEYERMLGLIELFGDPTLSKIPIIRWATQKVAQAELQTHFLSNHYFDKFKKEFGPAFANSPEKQKELIQHLHEVKLSTDPEILDAVVKYRTYKEDIANVLGAKERGWYLDKYATIKYDMNEIWNILKEPLIKVDSYGELPSSMKASMSNDVFETARKLAKDGKDWDKLPKPDQEWLQENVFNFQGVWSNWAYLPEFLQRSLPEKFFVANMQARTAGDAYKAALDYDLFDVERGYILSVVKGALLNEALKDIRPIVNRLPNASQWGSVRHYLERYMKVTSGTRINRLDPMWNSLARRINEALDANIVPLYMPTKLTSIYIPQLYRGLLGPDTALRNLTQSVYTLANNGPSETLKGVLRYVDERRRNTPEYQKFEQMISLPDEFLEIRMPIRPRAEARSVWDQIRYLNAKVTRAALWPMRLTEHVNKGIAYFAGLEEAARKGYDMNTAHIVGTAKASLQIPNLSLTEGQYKAFRSMGESQFLYTPAHTSPYLQGAGIKLFTPFWSFPIKTAQLLWNQALLRPVKGEKMGQAGVLAKPEYGWLRFMALTGFMATAPIITSNLFGVDTANIWGKGLFPFKIMPAWMEAMGNIYKSIGGDPGDFVDQERARNYLLRFIAQITLPNYRFIEKGTRNYFNAERGYRIYGREQRPLVETSYLDEVADLFGFPPSKFREANDLMKEYKDEKYRNMFEKHAYLYKAVDAMEDKDFNKAHAIIREAREEHGLTITSTEIQQAIAKKKDDIWLATKTSAPKAIRQRPEFQQTMGEAREKFMPSTARAYGTRPMWSSLHELIESKEEATPTIEIED